MNNVKIDLPDDLFERIKSLAEQQGVTIEEFALTGLEAHTQNHIKDPHTFTDFQIEQIEAGLADMASGRTFSHSEVVKDIEKYLKHEAGHLDGPCSPSS